MLRILSAKGLSTSRGFAQALYGFSIPTVINLIKGEIYFRAVFYDPELSIPSIFSYVYEGHDEKDGHMFIDAETCLEKCRGEELTEGNHYICYPEGSVATMLDKNNLIKWLQEDHSPSTVAEDYEYHFE